MTPKQLDQCLAKLELNRINAAGFLRVDRRTVDRWLDVKKPKPIPHAVALLLRTMISYGLAPEQVSTAKL